MSTFGFPALMANDHRVLRLLRDNGPQSRAALSVATGLSPTTITKIVAPLLDFGLLTEDSADTPARVGRPATKLRLNPSAIAVVGAHIGVGEVTVGIADGAASMRLQRSIRFDVSSTPSEVLELLADAIDAELRVWHGPAVIGVGVAVPGSADIRHRTNVLSLNLDWHDVPIADHLELRLRLPVVVEHNVRAMALADQRYGRPSELNLVYVYAQTGTGLGMVLNGEPFYSGAYGVSSLGHLRVDPSGRTCSCGSRGCVETVVSDAFLQEAVGNSDGPDVGSSLLHVLEDRARDGDLSARSALTELVEYLGLGLASVINLMGPRTIVMGGFLAEASSSFLTELAANVDSEIFPLLIDSYTFALPTFRDSEGGSAGSATALEYLLFTPKRAT